MLPAYKVPERAKHKTYDDVQLIKQALRNTSHMIGALSA